MLNIYNYQGNRLIDLRLKDNRIDGEAYDITLNEQVYNIDTLEFKVPMYIWNDGEREDNKRIDYLVNEYKVRLTYQDYDEYFYIKTPSKGRDSNGLFYNVQCVHVSSILNQKKTNTTVEITGNAYTILETILQGTGWTVGEVSTFEHEGVEKIRRFEASESSAMEMLTKLAEMVDGFLKFNSQTKTVDLKNEIGDNNGVVFRYNSNIKSLERQDNSDELVTRLWVIGGSVNNQVITIADTNPTGESYIEDYTYFNNLLSSAQQDSITQYQTDITNINTDINSAVDNITTTTNNKSSAEASLETKVMQRSAKQQLKNEIDRQISIEKDSTRLSELELQSSNIASEISTLNTEITNLETDISGYDSDLDTYNSNLSSYQTQKLNTMNTFVESLDEFVREGVFKDDSYVDSEDLYNDALELMEKVSQPMVEYTIDILDLSTLEGFELLKFDKGDILGICDKELNIGYPVPIAARITEITRVLDDESKNGSVRIANFRGAFSDQWSRIIKNVEIIKKRHEYYERSYKGLTADGLPKGDILQQAFDNNTFKMANGTNNNVEWGENGIIVTDLTDSNKKIKVNSNGFFLTADGGSTWKLGLSAEGFSGLNVTSGTIDTKNINIYNSEEPLFHFDAQGIYAFDSGTPESSDKWLRYNAKGIYGTNQSGVAKTSTTESDFDLILNWDKLQITKTDQTVRNIFSVTEGIKIQKGDGSGNWTDKFYTDASGDVFFAGNLSGATGDFSGSITIGTDNNVFKADGTSGIWLGHADYASAPFKVGLDGSLVANNVDISGALTTGAGSSIDLDYVAAGTITADRINGGTISGVTINISTNATIGEKIYLTNSTSTIDRGIFFGNTGVSIQGSTDFGFLGYGLQIAAPQTNIHGDVNLSSDNSGIAMYNTEEIATQAWVINNSTAKFG